MTDELEFSVGEVAAMLGMTPSTIRVWERRYQAVEPRRTVGGRRRYTIDDVSELHRIKVLVAAGGRSVKLAVLEAHGSAPAAPAAVAPSAAPPERPALPWKAVADQLPSLVLFLSRDGRVLDANQSLAETFGMSLDDLAGVRFTDFVHPHDRAKAVKLYATPLRERHGWELNLRTAPPRTCSFDSRLVGYPQGEVIMLIGRAVECAASEADSPSR